VINLPRALAARNQQSNRLKKARQTDAMASRIVGAVKIIMNGAADGRHGAHVHLPLQLDADNARGRGGLEDARQDTHGRRSSWDGHERRRHRESNQDSVTQGRLDTDFACRQVHPGESFALGLSAVDVAQWKCCNAYKGNGNASWTHEKGNRF
jgi:hypothetical protein